MLKKLEKILFVFLPFIIGAFILSLFAFLLFFPKSSIRLPINNGALLWIFAILILGVTTFFAKGLVKLFLSKCKRLLENNNAMLIIITACVAIPRAVWLFLVNTVPVSDFATYHSVASLLANGGIKGNSYISIFPHVFGYPAFLSVFYRIFGANVLVAQCLNVLLCIGIAILIFKIGSKILDVRCGFIAALLWAFWPSQIEFVSLVATEELFSFLVLLCIYLFLKFFEVKALKYTVLSFLALGILIGITNAVRPFGVVLILAFFIYYFIFSANKIPLKAFCFAFLAAGYFFSAGLISAGIEKAVGQPIARSPIGYNVYVGVNLESGGVWNEHDSNELGLLMDDKSVSPQQAHNILLEKAKQRLRRGGIKNLTLLYKKTINMWGADADVLWNIKGGQDENNPSILPIQKTFTLLNVINTFYYFVLLFSSLLGLYYLLKRKESKGFILLLILLAGIIGTHLIVEVSTRYHYPAIPLFALIASYGLSKNQKD